MCPVDDFAAKIDVRLGRKKQHLSPIDESLLANFLKKFIGGHVYPVLIELMQFITRTVQVDKLGKALFFHSN